jgi:uncharacterized protein (TIGR00251 family)
VAAIREDAGGVTVDVLVQPRASRDRIGPVHGDRIKVAVTAPPVDGEANAAVVALIARALGVARGAVEVVAGAGSRRKTVRIRGATRSALEAAIAPSEGAR